MQPNEHRSSRPQGAGSTPESGVGPVREFAEPIPDYLRSGYQALMAGDGETAINFWEKLFERYPSAEVCGHIARAHYYQTFFLEHGLHHPEHAGHILQMRLWAERALSLNPNSSIGHAMLAAAIGRLAQLTGSQRQIVSSSWQVRQHAERAILIDNNWIGHFVLGSWHREIASVHPGLRALAGLLRARIPEGSYAEAIRHFEEVLRQYPENNTIYADIAYTYEKLGDVKKASQMYERCLSMPLFRHPIASYLTAIAAARYQRLIKRANML
jgi:tetratricopeptide (TPR) repeat protein